jgi:hypothetical protein
MFGTIRAAFAAAALLAVAFGAPSQADGPDATVGLELVGEPGGGPVHGPVSWRIHAYKRGQGMGPRVVDVSGASTRVRLAAGTYELDILHEGGRMDHTIQVGAGAKIDYTLIVK